MIINSKRIYEVPDEDIFWQTVLAEGVWGQEEIDMLHSLVPNARTIIDVGANIGSTSIEYLQWAKTVHSFEPTPETFKLLQTNLKLNKVEAITHQCALSNKPGVLVLNQLENNKGSNFIQKEETASTCRIEARTLDSFNIENVDAIKIDVEGYELFVLQGAQKTIEKYRPVVQTEVFQEYFMRNGYEMQDVATWFYDRSYQCYDVKGKKQPFILPTDVGQYPIDLFWIPGEQT